MGTISFFNTHNQIVCPLTPSINYYRLESPLWIWQKFCQAPIKRSLGFSRFCFHTSYLDYDSTWITQFRSAHLPCMHLVIFCSCTPTKKAQNKWKPQSQVLYGPPSPGPPPGPPTDKALPPSLFTLQRETAVPKLSDFACKSQARPDPENLQEALHKYVHSVHRGRKELFRPLFSVAALPGPA